MFKKFIGIILSAAIVFSATIEGFATATMPVEPESQLTINQDEFQMLLQDSLVEMTAEADRQGTDGLVEESANSPVTSPMSEAGAEEYAQWKKEYVKQQESEALVGLSQNDMGISAASVNSDYIRNSIIEAFIGSQGRYTIGTVNGSSNRTTDDNKKLTFGHPGSTTSHSTIRIDGVDYTFDGEYNRSNTGLSASISKDIGSVTVTQTIAIVNNDYSGKQDTIAISYAIKNKGTAVRNAGARIMIDTMLDGNDGAPFRVPGYGNVTNELQLTGSQIPQSWTAFDRFEDPRVMSNGCFYRTLAEKPDMVQFAAWPGITGTLWDYTIDTNRILTNDSAVAIYYNPIALQPGETRTITTYYGIGDFAVQDTSPPLSMYVSAPSRLTADRVLGGYQYNPFAITAYVKNTGTGVAENVTAKLNLPAGSLIDLLSPSNPTISIGNVAVGAEKEVTWLVYARPQTTAATANYSVSVNATNDPGKTVNMSLAMPVTTRPNENYTVSLNKTTAQLTLPNQSTVQLTATCSDGVIRNVTWLSNKASVAKVNAQGLVTAVSPGTAQIIAAVGSKTAYCNVTVSGTATALTGLSLSSTSLSMKIGDSKTLSVGFTPTNAPNKTVKWTSNNAAVAKVNDNGKIEARAGGTAVITVTSLADQTKKATCNVTVAANNPSFDIGNGLEFNQTIQGPSVGFMGQNFNLFELPMKTELKIDEKISLVYDEAEQKLIGSFGFIGEETLTDVQSYKNNIQKIKKSAELLEKMGGAKFIKTYGSVLKNKRKKPFFTEGSDIRVFGHVEMQKVGNDFKVSEGKLYVVVELGELGWKFGFPPAVPVAYLKFSVSGSVEGGLVLTLENPGDFSSGKFNGFVGASVTLKGAVGADILVAGAEGGVKGTLSVDIEKIVGFVKENDLKVKFTASAYFKYHALFFLSDEKEWEFANVPLYPRPPSRALTMQSSGTMSQAVQRGLGEASSNSLLSEQNNVIVQTIPINGYAYNEPKLAELEDGRKIMAWADDVPTRAQYDRTAIYYAIWDDGVWGDPYILDDDDKAAFAPSIAADGNEVIVAWQAMDKTFGETATTLAAMLPHVGIKTAYFDGTDFRAAEKLTSAGDNYDSPPVVAAQNGKYSVVWANNSLNDWTLVTGNNTVKRCESEFLLSAASDNMTRLVAATTTEETGTAATTEETGTAATTEGTGTAATTVETETAVTSAAAAFNILSVNNVFSGTGRVSDYTIAYNGEDEIITLRYNDDIKVYKNRSVDTSFSTVSGINPVLVQTSSGADLFWIEEIIEEVTDEEGNSTYEKRNVVQWIKQMEIGSKKDCVELAVGQNFKVAEKDGNYIIYWSETDGYDANLLACIYDKESDTWSKPVSLMNHAGVLRSPDSIIVADNEMLFVMDIVELDDDMNDVGVSLAAVNIIQCGDISVDEMLYFDATSVLAGSEITLFADAANTGSKAVQGLAIELKNQAGTVLASKLTNEKIMPGESVQAAINYKIPYNFAQQKLVMEILPRGITDANLSDNKASAVIGDAQVVVESAAVSGYGRDRTITVKLQNKGYADVPNVTITARANSEDGTEIASVTISTLPARVQQYVELEVDMTAVDFAAEDGIMVYVDAQNESKTLSGANSAVTVLRKPVAEEIVSIGSGIISNNNLVLSLYNNVNSPVTGQLRLELLDGGDVVTGMSQTLTLGAYETMTSNLSIAALMYYQHDRISVYIHDDDGKVLSNIIYRNSTPIILQELSVTIDKSLVVLQKGENASLTAALSQPGVALADLEWISDDSLVASVDATGIVTAVGQGETIIAVQSELMKIKAECKVVVTEQPPDEQFENIRLRSDTVTVTLTSDTGSSVEFKPIFDLKTNNAMAMARTFNAYAAGDMGYLSSFIEGVELVPFGNNDAIIDYLFTTKLMDDARFLIIPTEQAALGKEYANKTYSADVLIKIKNINDKINIGKLTIKTNRIDPAVKVTVGKLDAFLNTPAAVSVSAGNYKIESLEIDSVVDAKNPTPQYFAYDFGDKSVKLASGYTSTVAAGNYPVRMTARLEGFSQPIKFDIKIPVTLTAPKLKLSKTTINLRSIYTGNYAGFELLSAAANIQLSDLNISDVSMAVSNDMTASEQKAYNNNGKFYAYYNYGDIYIRNTMTISGTTKVLLKVSFTNSDRIVKLPLTIKAVNNSTIKYTVSPKSVTLNKPIDGTTGRRYIKVNGAANNDTFGPTIYSEIINGKAVASKNIELFGSQYSNGTFSIGMKYSTCKAGSYVIRIYPNGVISQYVDVSVKVKDVPPVFKVSPSSLELNTITGESKSFTITNNMNVSSSYSYRVLNSKGQTVSGAVGYARTGNTVTITPYSYTNPGTYTLSMTSSDYSSAKAVKVKLNVKNTAPTLKLSSKSLVLNSALNYNDDSAKTTLSVAPATAARGTFSFEEKRGEHWMSLANFQVLQSQDALIVSRTSNNIADGKYKIRVVSDLYSTTKPVEIDITVKATQPKFTASSITLNSALPNAIERQELKIANSLKLSDNGGFEFYQRGSGNSLNALSDVEVSFENGRYYVSRSENSNITKGKVILVMESQSYSKAANVAIPVNIINSNPSLRITKLGKIDTVSPSTRITVKPKLVNTSIVLSEADSFGIDNTNFVLESYNAVTNELKIKAAPNADWTKKDAAKAIITYYCGADRTEIKSSLTAFSVTSGSVKLKPSVTSITLVKDADKDEQQISFVITGPLDARVDRIEFVGVQASQFVARCVSERNNLFMIGFAQGTSIAEIPTKQTVKANVYIRGNVKPVSVSLTIVAK